MLSNETLEKYKRMTNAERLKLALQMTQEGLAAILTGPPDQVARRFELLRLENDERNRRMLEGIARSKENSGGS